MTQIVRHNNFDNTALYVVQYHRSPYQTTNMNTSNIDALAAAAEARVGEGIIMSPREGLDDATPNSSIQESTALPPLPPLNSVGAAEAVPLANQFSHGGLRGDQEEVLQNGQGDIIARVDMPQVAAQPHQQQPTQKATASKSTSRRKPTFAEKLQFILSNKQLSSLITWLPSGKSFCILDKDRFAQR
eukprot:scaffold16636_cov32-Cyclotella_meneghiniana.AAC.1